MKTVNIDLSVKSKYIGGENMAVTFYYNGDKVQIFKVFSGTLNDIVPMHSHSKNGYELHYIDSGKGILDTGSKTFELKKDTLFMTGPKMLHKQIPDNHNPMHELCVYFKLTGHKFNNDIMKAFASKDFWIGKINSEIKHIFRQMTEENKRESRWKDDILSSLSIRLITELTGLYFPEEKSSSKKAESADLNENRSWILDQLLLEDCSNVTLNDFAEKMGVSPRHAERIIKDYYGTSFKKLRYEAKMAMAATLLEQQKLSVDECSLRCGYTSSSAFITAFKRKYGITPKTYREECKTIHKS